MVIGNVDIVMNGILSIKKFVLDIGLNMQAGTLHKGA